MKIFLIFLGMVLYFFTHLYSASQVAGLHFDEAWAANFSYKIAFEKGFWPLHAMSPYTAPWGHYLAALIFKLFGASLFTFRLSAALMTGAGTFLISAALWEKKKKTAATVFPFLSACFFPAIIHHRFHIEVTTFHYFCFGLLAWGVSLFDRKPLLAKKVIAATSVLGVTSHIAFLAPVLGLLGTWVLSGQKTKIRWLVFGVALGLFPFFLRIWLEIPERDKSTVLLGADLLILIWAAFGTYAPKWVQSYKNWILGFVFLLCLPYFGFLLAFLEGHWDVLLVHGFVAQPFLVGLPLLIVVPALIFLKRRYRKKFDPSWGVWFLFTLVATAILAVKPASRFFEPELAFVLAFSALAFEILPWKKTVLGICIFSGLIPWQMNYILPGEREQGRIQAHKVLLLRDWSNDFMPKQILARFLGEQGCRLSDIQFHDPRLKEALSFLSHGDWPVLKTECALGHPQVFIGEEYPSGWNGSSQAIRVGPFGVVKF